MRVIDAHHHLWDLDRLSYPWLTDPVEHFAGDYSSIRQSYLIDDFLADIGMAQDIELSKSVHVEADLDRRIDPVQETAWLQSIADNPASGGRPNAIARSVAESTSSTPGTDSIRRATRSTARSAWGSRKRPSTFPSKTT